jgi:hypothetical protein
MAQFNLKRPNGSRHDLPPEKHERFESIRSLVIAIGKGRYITEAVIVQLLTEFDADKVFNAISRMHGRGFFSLDTLQGMLVGEIEMERKSAPVNEMPGRDRSAKLGEPLRVGEMMQQSLRTPMTDLPPSVMNEDDAVRWIVTERHGDPNHLLDYFDHYGRNSAGKTFYQLKPEYR